MDSEDNQVSVWGKTQVLKGDSQKQRGPSGAKVLHNIGPFISLVLFSGALWVLHRELKAYHLREIVQQFESLPPLRVLLAGALTVASYFVMTGYDFFAIRFVERSLAYPKILLASFVAYAFGNNLGFAMLAGGSVRYRLYSAWGLSAFDVTKLIAFCSLSFWLGFLILGGAIFLVQPMAIPGALHLPFASVHPLGVLFLAVAAGYIAINVSRKKPVKIREWEFSLPSIPLLLGQIGIALLDWCLAGAVLYALLPRTPALSYFAFMGIFLFAQTAGVVSQVPAGLGIFDTVIIILLGRVMPAPQVAGALVAYRILYYLLPLLAAALLLGLQEVLERKEHVKFIVRLLGEQTTVIVPNILAFLIFIGGAILVLSGATPAVEWRQHLLKGFLPLPVLEVSHFLGSLIGLSLLVLARGIQRRLNAAFSFTIVLLCLGICLSLLKGLDYIEATILLFMLIAFVPCRKHFYRKTSLLDEPFAPGWIVAILIVFVASLWLGSFSYKHVEYSSKLWWQFAFSANAPRFLRATVGVVILALFFAVLHLLRPAQPRELVPTEEERECIGEITRKSESAAASLALLGDKSFLLNKSRNAFIMYGVEGRSWVAMGNPVGPVEEWAELAWQFRELCDLHDGWTVFYEVGEENLPVYIDLGLTLLKLGEEARVELEKFDLGGSARRGMRNIKSKMERNGWSFQVVPAEEVGALLPKLKSISDAWLEAKNAREKGFSLGFFQPEYLQRFPVGIISKNGEIAAFANFWAAAEKKELSVDLMRYHPQAPRDIMEFLFLEAMLWGKQEGYVWFNLGMAPLSGIEDHTLAPLWNRLGALVFRHGEHFYNFQGLRQYKEKFDPQWAPKYLASPGGISLPRILANIASLISGGLVGVLKK